MGLKDLLATYKRPSSVVGPVERYMLGLSNDKSDRRKYCFHPSSIGKGCARKLQYEFLDFKAGRVDRVIKPTLRLVFDTGHALQEVYVKHMIGAGLFIREDIERPMSNPKHLIFGHADAYSVIRFKGMDMKTTRDPVPYWDNGREEVPFVEMTKPHDGYVIQMQSYMACDERATEFALVYMNKNDQTLKEFVIERDEEMIGQILETTTNVVKACESRVLVHRPDHVEPKKAPCMFCEYRGHCWNDLAPMDWTTQEEIEKGIIDLTTGQRKDVEGV